MAESNIPVPDPSVLTTENLRREVTGLRELIEARLTSNHELYLFRLASLETRFQDADRLYMERFQAADLRYQQRYDAADKALAAASEASQSAVNAALAAAKEAVNAASISAEKAVAAQNDSNAASILKSEMSVTKQIDGIMALLAANSKTLDEKIAAINSRLDRGDGVSLGANRNRTEARLDLGSTLAIGAFIVAVLVGILAFYNASRISEHLTPQLYSAKP